MLSQGLKICAQKVAPIGNSAKRKRTFLRIKILVTGKGPGCIIHVLGGGSDFEGHLFDGMSRGATIFLDDI